jgi:hypothetical protein
MSCGPTGIKTTGDDRMNVTAYLLAFGTEVPIPERIIEVPDHEVCPDEHDETIDHGARLLELVFYYGQNDFQPKPIRSLSCGDVVEMPDGSLHRVLGVGWEHLPEGTDVTMLERGVEASLR